MCIFVSRVEVLHCVCVARSERAEAVRSFRSSSGAGTGPGGSGKASAQPLNREETGSSPDRQRLGGGGGEGHWDRLLPARLVKAQSLRDVEEGYWAGLARSSSPGPCI